MQNKIIEWIEWEYRPSRTILPIVFLVDWIDELRISGDDDDDDDVCDCSKLVTLVDVSPVFDPIDGAASVTPIYEYIHTVTYVFRNEMEESTEK